VNVSDVMTSSPTVVFPSASIGEALQLMTQIGCHHLPVISVERHLIGVLSIHDCQRVLGEVLKGKPQPTNTTLASSILVSSAMTPAPIILEPDAPAHQAARLMLEHFIGCLPIMRGETLVGIVTRSDLLMAFMALCQKPIKSIEP